MKRIPLTQGQFALVDDEDFDRLSKHKWYATWNPSTSSFYASRHSFYVNGKRNTILMHREVLVASADKQVDHANRDSLDNRRKNLRLCSGSENCANRRVGSNSTSGFKGVSLDKLSGTWRARVRKGGKLLSNSYHPTAESAARAYDEATIRLNGEFALTNRALGLVSG
jgi:hypothetical protein